MVEEEEGSEYEEIEEEFEEEIEEEEEDEGAAELRDILGQKKATEPKPGEARSPAAKKY